METLTVWDIAVTRRLTGRSASVGVGRELELELEIDQVEPSDEGGTAWGSSGLKSGTRSGLRLLHPEVEFRGPSWVARALCQPHLSPSASPKPPSVPVSVRTCPRWCLRMV